MKNIISIVAAFSMLFCSCSSADKKQSVSNSNTIAAPDEAAIKKAVDDAYAAISFKQGETPNYDSIKFAFIPQAQTINYIGDTAQILSIDDFVKAFFKQHLFQLEWQSIRLKNIWNDLPEAGNDVNATLSGSHTLWEAMEQLANNNAPVYVIDEETRLRKEVTFEDLKMAIQKQKRQN